MEKGRGQAKLAQRRRPSGGSWPKRNGRTGGRGELIEAPFPSRRRQKDCSHPDPLQRVRCYDATQTSRQETDGQIVGYGGERR
jgi:hypothetical protein